MNRLALAAGIGALLLAMLAWWFVPVQIGQDDAGHLQRGSAAEQPERALAAGGMVANASTGRSVERTELICTDLASRLVLKLVNGKGLPVPATVSWTASVLPPRTLPSNSVVARAAARVSGDASCLELQAPEGLATIERSANSWVWVRIDATGCAHPVFLLAPPAVGEVVQRVEVPPSHGRLHVLALAADFCSGIDGAAIECVDDTDEVVWHGTTDAHGYVMGEVQTPGEYRVRIVGDQSDCPDREARIQFFADGPHDTTALLAASEPTVACRLSIDADFHAGPKDQPVVLLRRLDPGREIAVLVTPDLQAGSSVYDLKLPAGDYLPALLPQGRLEFAGGVTPLHLGVGEPQSARLRLSEPKGVTLELQAISPLEMPFAVRCVDEDDLFDSAERRIWCGPTNWRQTHATVGGWQGDARIVAHNRRSVWVSAESHCSDGGRVLAVMRPGCELTVRRSVDRGGHGETLVAQHALGEVARVLRPALVQTLVGKEPCTRAVVFVPLGEVRLLLMDGNGKLLGERTVQAAKPWQTVAW